jgi:Na+/melibiose symporter-like transporter
VTTQRFVLLNEMPLIVSLLAFSNRIFTEGICKLFDLIIADLIDEDQYLHRRSSPLPAFIFGLMTFLSKPGQTLAPIVSSHLLYSADHQRSPLFAHLILIPILCSFSQLILWRKFTLHSHRLKSVRSLSQHSIV